MAAQTHNLKLQLTFSFAHALSLYYQSLDQECLQEHQANMQQDIQCHAKHGSCHEVQKSFQACAATYTETL